MAPRFREGKLADGIDAGLDAIGGAIAGTYQQPVRRAPQRGWDPGLVVIVGAFALSIVLALVAALQNHRRGRRRGWTGGRGG